MAMLAAPRSRISGRRITLDTLPASGVKYQRAGQDS
jgi:hypothetical protein